MGSEGSSTPIFVTVHVYCLWFGTFTSWGTALVQTTDETHLTILVCPIGFELLKQFFQVRVFSVLVSAILINRITLFLTMGEAKTTTDSKYRTASVEL